VPLTVHGHRDMHGVCHVAPPRIETVVPGNLVVVPGKCQMGVPPAGA
jgi:hypothetical protein